MTEYIAMECPMCGKVHKININEDQSERYERYLRKEGLIQDLLPEFNPVEREFIKSGYCPKCQEMLFGNGETKLIEEMEW